MNIEVLDCTLRDGGYVNNWKFEKEVSKNIIEGLAISGIEYIEVGFLDKTWNEDDFTTRFKSVDILENFLKKIDKKKSKIVVLIEIGKFDIENLPLKKDTNIDVIRLTFRKSDKQNALIELKKIIEKGYKVFAQPITTKSYSDREILDLVEEINLINVEGLAIVDTHGSMTINDFNRIYYLYDNNLKKDIKISFHSHNNSQLSYALAINAIEKVGSRELVIDSSVYGMGRGAGNLNTELITEYINKKIGERYKLENLLEIIENYLESIHQEFSWGYSLAMYLSANNNCHPNYANYLLETRSLPYNLINSILSKIPSEEKIEYNKDLIESIYYEFKSKNNLELKDLERESLEKKILLLAPGKSVSQNYQEIVKKINSENLQVISINHLNNEINQDYYFFSNQNRYDEFKHNIIKNKLIVSSNINLSTKHYGCYVLDYTELVKNDKNDNAAILFLKYLINNNVNLVKIAGFDGFEVERNNYSQNLNNTHFSRDEIEILNNKIKSSLKNLSQKIRIKFITPSIYLECIKPKIIGVIPSRIGSTRLPRKALLEIDGIPLVIHVLKRAQMSQTLDDVYVATDSSEIYDIVLKYGGKAIMTSEECENGTARVVEVSKKIDGDIFVQINGDEIVLNPKDIDTLVSNMEKSKNVVGALLVTKTRKFNYPSEIKVLLNKNNELIVITRADVPSSNRGTIDNMLKGYFLTAYYRESLELYEKLGPTNLEKIESINELRFLENGYTLKAIEVENQNLSVDTLEDLNKAKEIINDDKFYKKYKGCKI